MFPIRSYPRAVLSAVVFTAALFGTACDDSTAPSNAEGSGGSSQEAQVPSDPSAAPDDAPAAPKDTTGTSVDTTASSAALKPATSVAAAAAGSVICYLSVSAPARAFSSFGDPRVAASGWINYCTGPVIQANVTTWLYQYYGGAWHVVASKTVTRYGIVTSQLKATASVACTGALTGYWFQTVGKAYATSTSGYSTGFPFASAPRWVTC